MPAQGVDDLRIYRLSLLMSELIRAHGHQRDHSCVLWIDATIRYLAKWRLELDGWELPWEYRRNAGREERAEENLIG